jgi:actin-like ATPase involved in cell morphogenesis
VLRDTVGLPVVVADDPARAVARGAAQLLDDLSLFERLAVSP